MSFQPAFNARLINEVKKHPCLYNHSRRGNGDTMERQRLWHHIATNIGQNCTPEFAKKRWLQLRDRYRKELKLAIRNNFITPVRWIYFSQLSWLDPYLKDNISQVADETKKTKEYVEEYGSFNWFQFPSLNGIKDEIDDDDGDPALESSVLDRLLASATQRNESISPEMENDESGPQSVDGEPNEIEDELNIDSTNSAENVIIKEEQQELIRFDSIDKADDENRKDQIASAIEALSQTPKPSVETLIAANQARFAHHLLAAQLTGISQVMLNGSKKNGSTPQPFFNEAITQQSSPPQNFQQTGFKENYKSKQQRQNAENLMKTHLQQVGRTALEWLNDEDLLYSRIIGLKLKKMDPKKRKKVRDQIMVLLDESEEVEKDDDSCSSHTQSARDNDEEPDHVSPGLENSNISPTI